MASSFMGLYVQREALVTAQKALDITGNNISNVKTTGYSRQRVDVCSVANKGYNLFYNTSVSMAGQGVDTVGITQLRDALLDRKVRTYNTQSTELNAKGTIMSDVETALDCIESDTIDDTKGYSIIANFAKFKEALQSFSADNADREELANVAIQSAKSFVQQMNYLSTRLDDISQQTLGDAQGAVSRVNSILESMGTLNEQITNSYISMGYISSTAGNYIVDNDYGPLELKDKMNNLLDELSNYGDVSVKEENNGSFTVSFAGQIVVHNKQYAQMAMTEETPKPFDMAFTITNAGTYDPATDTYSGLKDADDWYKLQTQFGSTELYTRQDADAIDITGTDKLNRGELRAYLDTYNGDGVYATDGGNNYQGIEYYRDMLNALAKTMTEKLNEIFEPDFGFTLFSYADAHGNKDFHSAAANFRVSDDWINDPTLISKPEKFLNGKEDDMDELNNEYVNKILGAFSTDFTYGYTDAAGKDHNDPVSLTFEKYLAHISDTLGTQIDSNNKLQETTDIMLESVVSARDEVMAVSVNEEGINMMNYQKWYNAIARMVTTLDEALDKVINGMGIVGL